MSPAQKSNSAAKQIGQLLIIGFDGTELTPALSAMLDRMQPAGVILFARNIINAQQTHQLLRDCQARVKQRLFTCVDLEGGRVDRFRNVTGPAPSAAEVFATGERKLFRKHGQLIAKIWYLRWEAAFRKALHSSLCTCTSNRPLASSCRLISSASGLLTVPPLSWR